MPEAVNDAEQASVKALEAVYACLREGKSFRLEAGAGAGKTYSLIKALTYLIQTHRRSMPRRNQKIACITYTNVARDEIAARIDRSPLVYCDTNHAFCWSLISTFQRQLRTLIVGMPAWRKRIEEAGGLPDLPVEYSLGHRGIREHNITLHHDDVLPLTIQLMESEKFRRLMVDRFPIILIDEYQDTDKDWVEAIKRHYLGKPNSPQFGFFGDHWQKIYGDGCGALEHPSLTTIGKEANFRSVQAIVDPLNNMRPSLPQFVKDPTAPGEVRIFHSNAWTGARRTGAHWAGDLPAEASQASFEQVKEVLTEAGWEFVADQTKILMLTHRVLATQQGYSSLPSIFQYNDAFSKKAHPYIAYFVDVLEPACDAYSHHMIGAMFEALGSQIPSLSRTADKGDWNRSLDNLLELRENGTIGDVVDHLRTTKRPQLPDALEEAERQRLALDPNDPEPPPRELREIIALRKVRYAEIKALRAYHAGFSPFETKHGVKGAEFDSVFVVIGRGWSDYNFGEMLGLALEPAIPPAKQEAFERNRNLFYVACSRPRRRLAILFTQRLSDNAIRTLTHWFGPDNVRSLEY